MNTVSFINFVAGLAIGVIMTIIIYGNAFERSMRALGDSTVKFVQRKLMAKPDSDESND